MLVNLIVFVFIAPVLKLCQVIQNWDESFEIAVGHLKLSQVIQNWVRLFETGMHHLKLVRATWKLGRVI